MSRVGTLGVVAWLVLAALPGAGITARPGGTAPGPIAPGSVAPSADTALANFSAALGRLVELVGAGGGALLALVWARVALSWFSNDVAKKVQAKDRARDALVGSLIFAAALSGLAWGLTQWVLTGH